MSQQPTPQWQPMSQLALIASHIDGMLEAAQEQYQGSSIHGPGNNEKQLTALARAAFPV